MSVKNLVTNNIFVITNAVNEKNGANGSIIDLIIALKKEFTVNVFTLRRPLFIGLIESLINIGIFSFNKSLLLFCRFLFKEPKAIFFIGNTPNKQIQFFKYRYPNSKLFIFQTGDIKNNELESFKIDIVDYILFQSPGQMKEFKKIYIVKQDKAILLRPTIKEKKFNSYKNNLFNSGLISKKEPICFVIIGSIQERKNQLKAIEFCKILKDKYNLELKLFVVGPFVNVDYKNKINNFVEKNELKEMVVFTGFKKNYAKYLCKSHILLSFSKEEGLSTIIRESLFLGKIIIASNISGNKGTLDDQNSIIFNLEDDMNTVTRKVLSILQDRRKCISMMNISNETYIKNHSQEIYSKTLKDIVCNII